MPTLIFEVVWNNFATSGHLKMFQFVGVGERDIRKRVRKRRASEGGVVQKYNFLGSESPPRKSESKQHTILFKIITRIKLLFSNYLGRYSYSFRARQELISATVTVLWV